MDNSDAAQHVEVLAVLSNRVRSLYDPEFLLEVFQLFYEAGDNPFFVIFNRTLGRFADDLRKDTCSGYTTAQVLFTTGIVLVNSLKTTKN